MTLIYVINDKLCLFLQRDNGGVVMVNFYPNYISCQDEANVTQVAGNNVFEHLAFLKQKWSIEKKWYALMREENIC